LRETKAPAVDPEEQASDGQEDQVYPGDHGDWRAIVSSIGCFFALFVGFGILNIPGTFVTYWENNQLQGYSQSQVGWIAAMQFFLTLSGSVFTGRWFDLHGGKVLALSGGNVTDDKLCLLVGSVLFIWAFFMVSLCTEYYQFFLAYGVRFLLLSCSLISGSSGINRKHDVQLSNCAFSNLLVLYPLWELQHSGIITTEDSLLVSPLQAVP
jgi:MFS family permease